MVLTWLRRRDRGLVALRRAGRTAIVMPAMFAVGDLVIGNTTTAAFAAFGSFASLLLFDPPGPMRARLRAQLALARRRRASSSAWHGRRAVGAGGRRGDRDRRLRDHLLRRRQLAAGRRHDVAAAGFHPRGLPAGAGLLDPRPARRLGPRVGRRAARCRAAVAGTGARSRALRGDRRVPRARGAAADRGRAPARRGRPPERRRLRGRGRRGRRARRGAARRLLRDALPADRPEHRRPHGCPAGRRAAVDERRARARRVSGGRARRPVGLRRQARRRGGARARGGAARRAGRLARRAARRARRAAGAGGGARARRPAAAGALLDRPELPCAGAELRRGGGRAATSTSPPPQSGARGSRS